MGENGYMSIEFSINEAAQFAEYDREIMSGDSEDDYCCDEEDYDDE